MRFLLLALAVFLLSCQKEIEALDQPNQPSNACKLTTGYSYNLSGAVADSTTYIYTGDLLTKIGHNKNFDSLLFQYTNNRITKRTYYDLGQIAAYDNLYYNNDGTLQKWERLVDLSSFGGGIERFDSILFSYNNGKMIKQTHYEVALFSNDLTLSEENLFQYSGNNISQCVRLRYGSSGGTSYSADTTLFQYDALPNYLRKNSISHLLADPAFFETDVHLEYYALFLSENNPTKVWDAQFPANAETITYETDSKGNVMVIRSGGDPLIGYKYKCQ